jgi:hypothetical protein
MDDQGRIPRSRGGVSGVMLILLGLWGGLAPFIGPYIHFGFTPDTAWAYNQGRLYYSAVPGAAALVGGVLVLVTRNRGVGIAGGVLGVLAGAWFGLGDGFITTVLKKTSISIGSPLVPAGAGVQLRTYLETISFFGGLGLVVLFFGALAVGRFSLLAAKDLAPAAEAGDYYETQTGFPTAAGQFPRAQQFPSASTQYPETPPGYPTVPTTGQ